MLPLGKSLSRADVVSETLSVVSVRLSVRPYRPTSCIRTKGLPSGANASAVCGAESPPAISATLLRGTLGHALTLLPPCAGALPRGSQSQPPVWLYHLVCLTVRRAF